MLAKPAHQPIESSRNPRWILITLGLPLLQLLLVLGLQNSNLDVTGWSDGFSHPLSGWDHLVTMLGIGIWAVQLRGHAIWMLPLTFVSVMSLGGLAGASDLAMQGSEGVILLSCSVIGVLIARGIRFSTPVNLLIVALFAFFHGYAHGQEISTSASLISYSLGFMLATLLLHGAGILLAKLLVLAITCLLTLMSSTLLANNTAQHAIGLDQKGAASSQETEFSPTSYWLALRQSARHTDDANTIIRFDQSTEAISGKIFKQDLRAMSDHFPGHAINHFEKSSPIKASLWSSLFGFRADELLPSSLSFKHYFPDINYTPGSRMLSNGVGLTSPPLSSNDSIQPIFPLVLSTPVPFIEEPHLQLIFAKSTSGNPQTTSSNHYLLHADASTPSNVLRVAGSAKSRPAYALLMAFDHFNRPRGIDSNSQLTVHNLQAENGQPDRERYPAKIPLAVYNLQRSSIDVDANVLTDSMTLAIQAIPKS